MATRLADGLDPLTPRASGHGRIAARHADGGLWVWQGGSMPFVRPHFDELLAALDFALAKSDPARGEYAGAV